MLKRIEGIDEMLGKSLKLSPTDREVVMHLTQRLSTVDNWAARRHGEKLPLHAHQFFDRSVLEIDLQFTIGEHFLVENIYQLGNALFAADPIIDAGCFTHDSWQHCADQTMRKPIASKSQFRRTDCQNAEDVARDQRGYGR